MTLKPGDKVYHKLSGELMEIRTIKDGIATCWQIEKEKEWVHWQGNQVLQHPRCICDVKNLESVLENRQLKLL